MYNCCTVLEATLPEMDWFWHEQKDQFPQLGEPGITYFQRKTPLGVQDVLLFYAGVGKLSGLLYYYPQDISNPAYRNRGYRNSGHHYSVPPELEFLERAGTYIVCVDPERRRQGIGSALLHEAMRRWNIDHQIQNYSEAGLALAKAVTGS